MQVKVHANHSCRIRRLPLLSKSPVIDLQSILNPAPHTPWSPPLLFVTVPQGRETNDVPFQNIYWRIVASQCCLVVAVQQSESAIHIHAPLLFQSFFPFRSRLPWWLRWFSSAYNAGDPGSIPGSGRCPGEGNGTPRQYSCLENPMDGGTWRATVHGSQSQTRLSD